MPPSDDFRAALRAGKVEEAFLLAMGRATQLNVTTWVVPAGQELALVQPGPRPGWCLRTRINLLQGDIENEVGDRFLREPNYQELRQFHQTQVGKGSDIVAQNIESLRRLFGVMQALYSTPATADLEATTAEALESVTESEAFLLPSADWATLADLSPEAVARETAPPAVASPRPGASSELAEEELAEEWAVEQSAPAWPSEEPEPPGSALDPEAATGLEDLAAPAREPEPELEPLVVPDPWQEQQAQPELPPAALDDCEPAELESLELEPFEPEPTAPDATRNHPPEAAAPLTFSWDDLAAVTATAATAPAPPSPLDTLEPIIEADLEALFRDLEAQEPADPSEEPEPELEVPEPVSTADDPAWEDFVAFVEADRPEPSPRPELSPDLAESTEWGEWFADDAASERPPEVPLPEFPEAETLPLPRAREEDWEAFTPEPFAPNPEPPWDHLEEEHDFFTANFLIDEPTTGQQPPATDR